jgi:DNA-binding Lrp family transcriptional regulator
MDIKQRIIEVLSKHPEGLTFTQIAVELGMHRHTITKYIYKLDGEGVIFVRDLKTLKLCYLKTYVKNENSEVVK